MNKMIFLRILTFSLFITAMSCSKKDSKVQSEAYTLERLMKDYKLKDYSVIPNFDKNNVIKFSDVASAKMYLDSLEKITFARRVFRGKAKITPLYYKLSTGGLLKIDDLSQSLFFDNTISMSACGPCGSGRANTSAGFGNFSTMHLNFEYSLSGTRYEISNLNSYVTGIPIGISWNQVGQPYNYSSSSYIAFCVPGTVTVGLQVGNIVVGFIREYHYWVQVDPCGSGYDITQDFGGC